MAGSGSSAPDRRRLALIALAALLTAFAYRALVARAFELPNAGEVESWMFRPSRQPAFLVLAVAGWLLYRRRAQLAPIADRPGSASLGAVFALLGFACFVWALLTRSVDLLLPSLGLNVLALAALSRGAHGLGAAWVPALVLLLGMAIPAPLEAEIVWHLQKWSASGATWILGAAGQDVARFGVLLKGEGQSFHVIDACSGLAGIEILLMVSLLVRELFAGAGRRVWAVVVVAPLLGLGLNMVRIAYIANAGSGAGDLDGGHTLQGVVVLTVGTAVLYGFALALAGGEAPDAPALRRAPVAGRPLWSAVVGIAGLALLSVAVRPFRLPIDAYALTPIEFPEQVAGWVGRPIEGNAQFIGPLPAGQKVHRRYEPAGGRGAVAVELFVASEVWRFVSSSRLLSSKLRQPGPDWELESTRTTRVWALDREASLSIARRSEESTRAVAYTWRLRDEGLWRESLRSLLALEASPWRREGQRTVVQLVAFAAGGAPLLVDQAKQRLDQFATRFRAQLDAL